MQSKPSQQLQTIAITYKYTQMQTPRKLQSITGKGGNYYWEGVELCVKVGLVKAGHILAYSTFYIVQHTEPDQHG